MTIIWFSASQVTLISAQRLFVRRVDVADMGNPSKGTKGDPITLFLFSDCIEVRLLCYLHYLHTCQYFVPYICCRLQSAVQPLGSL